MVLAAFRVKVKGLALAMALLSSHAYCIAPKESSPIIKYIQQGEQFSVTFPKGAQYSIGSKKTLKAKVLRKRKKILIKGVKPGLSDLIIWNSEYSTSYQIYVTNHEKKNHKSLLTRYLKSQQIQHRDHFDIMILETKVQTREQLRYINKYCQGSCEGIISSILTRNIISDIYKIFLSHKLPYIYCSTKQLEIQCTYQSDDELPFQEEINHYLQYGVVFQKSYSDQAQNFEVQFNISQLESSDIDELNLGLDRLTSELSPFINNDPGLSIASNPVNFSLDHFQASSLARPKIITTYNSDNEVKVGNEIPFETSNQFTQNIQWKFAGLKIKFKIFKKSQKTFINYQASISSQEGDQITGHYKQAILSLSPDQQNLLFEIDIDSNTKSEPKMKFFSRLPIIGKLFRGKNKTQTYSKIIGTVYIKKLYGADL